MSEWERRLGGKKDVGYYSPPGHEAGQRYRYRSSRGGGEVSYAYPLQQPARQKIAEQSNLSSRSFKSYPSVQSTHTLRSTKDEDHCPKEHRSSTASRYKQQLGSLQPISTAPSPRTEFTGPFVDQNDQPIVGSLRSAVGSTVDSSYPSLEFTDSSSGSSNVSWAEEVKLPARIRPLATPPQKQHPPCHPSYKTIEVAPGQHLRLRGADETTQAIQDDFYIPCECSCCTKTILCIQDADYVLCPDCRVVSPIREQLDSGKSNGGVGLGFKVESLFADSTF